jgi:hypothetical protein
VLQPDVSHEFKAGSALCVRCGIYRWNDRALAPCSASAPIPPFLSSAAGSGASAPNAGDSGHQ